MISRQLTVVFFFRFKFSNPRYRELKTLVSYSYNYACSYTVCVHCVVIVSYTCNYTVCLVMVSYTCNYTVCIVIVSYTCSYTVCVVMHFVL